MAETSPAEAIFFEALKRPPAERAAFLGEACGGDAGLRARLEAMLVAQPELGGFLDVPQRTGAYEPPAEGPGGVIAGRYKLLQQIGEGGMGTVWMADQTEPVQRRVAVKLIREERGGSGTVLARFEAERQAIALMEHPHIAKLLDAGTTGGEPGGVSPGRPYFVMELVKGIPLTDYCDQHKLEIPQRLHLFMQICSAVQHAHQKGVIHRDLKPGNILVESHDGKPVPKVIDFGLAKATSGLRLTEHTLFTAFGAVAGTPLYMAPEQAAFNAVDVDTRADVYALGVLLYELLTGTTPIERAQLKKAAFDEILRVIRESEPPTPSKRLSSTESKPGVAANRGTDPVKLSRQVRGELDWVVMKALAKERDRRYETASGLARDVERYLGHEPVLAGPPGAAYRLRKFVRRHRAQVVAGSLLLLALLAGIAGTTYGLFRAESRRAEAERARDRTRQVLDEMTSEATGDSLTTQAALSAEQKKFLAGVLAYYQEFAGERADDEQSRARTAKAAVRVGKIQDRLGRKEEAVESHRRALVGFESLVADFPTVPEHRRWLAHSHGNLGTFLWELGHRAEAQEEYRQAIRIGETLAADFSAVPEYRQDLARLCRNLGKLLADLAKWPEAEEQERRALAIRDKLAAQSPAVGEYGRELADSHFVLGFLLRQLGKYPEAEQQHRLALDIMGRLSAEISAVPESRVTQAGIHHQLVLLVRNRGKWPEAEEHCRKALLIYEKLVAEYPAAPAYRHLLGGGHNNLGILLFEVGKWPEAEKHYLEALAIWKKLAADSPAEPEYQVDLGGNYCNLANLVKNGNRPRDSLAWYEKAIRTLTAVYEADHRLVQAKEFLRNCHEGRAEAYDLLGQYAEAARDWDRTFELGAEQVPLYRAYRASSWVKTGRVSEAVQEVAELTKTATWPAGQWYDFACVYSLASGKSPDKKKEYADRAMELLQKADRAGYADAAHMNEDTDLAPLRGRDDFQKLVAELAKKPPAGPGKKL